MQYSLVGHNGEQNITVWRKGEAPLVAHSDHPNFDKIVQGALANDESVVELFDIALTVATRFEDLSERVSVANGRVYFDGDEVHNSLTEQVVRFLNEDVEDWVGLVNFFENVQQNPQEHSREMLYDWLQCHDFTITPEGMIVGYKGVTKRDDGSLVSGYSGKATVDGEVFTGQIPNRIGSVVEMPRGEVTFDPKEACSRGLHVGTFSYAKSYAHGAMLEVHVNPRDVVSVPTDASGEKVRVCRYRIVDTIDAPLSSAVTDDWDSDDYDDDFYCGDCGRELPVADRGLETYCEACREDAESYDSFGDDAFDDDCQCNYESCCGDPGCCCDGAGGPPKDLYPDDDTSGNDDFEVDWGY